LKITSHDPKAINVDTLKRAVAGQNLRTNKERVLDDAKTAVVGERNKSYGPPVDNFNRIVAYWEAHMEMTERPTKFKPEDVAVFMILAKLARLAETPAHRDSIVDIAGYAACYGDVVLAPEAV
jgi:Domain of unknown function (DUF6378)